MQIIILFSCIMITKNVYKFISQMQKNDTIPEKGLFTFYKQQQNCDALQSKPLNPQTSSIPNRLVSKKKGKQKSKHKTQSIQKSSPENASNIEFQPIQQESRKKPKPHKKGSKLSKKKSTRAQVSNNSTFPQNKQEASLVQNNKQHFLSIVNTYNTNQKPFKDKLHANSVSLVLKNKQKAKIHELRKIIIPTVKKTIISEANMTIKPFQKQSSFDEDDYLFNGFGSSINLCKKNLDFIQQTSELISGSQLGQKAQTVLDNDNQSIKEKFLSRIIKKNVPYDHLGGCQRKLQFQKARCLTELSQKKESMSGLFQNRQITESLAQNQDDSSNKNRQIANKKTAQNTIDKYLRFESKTQELRKQSQVKGQLRRFSKVTSVHLPHEKEENFRCEINSSSFMPVNKSCLTNQEVIRSENSQIFESYQVYQHYRKLKTKSKKLLRFSIIKSHTTNGIEINAMKGTDKSPIKDTQNSNKLIQDSNDKKQQCKLQAKQEKSASKQTLKLPMIAQGCRKMDKLKPRVLSSVQKTAQKEELAEQKKLSAKNNSQIVKTNNFPTHSRRIKQSQRSYTQQAQPNSTQIDAIKNKILTIIGTERNQNHKSRLSRQPEEVDSSKFIEKSVSTKIIQNFQERHYRKAEQDKECSKLSTLDMSENFILNWKESLDWKSKKKLIIKKLGIQI